MNTKLWRDYKCLLVTILREYELFLILFPDWDQQECIRQINGHKPCT